MRAILRAWASILRMKRLDVADYVGYVGADDDIGWLDLGVLPLGLDDGDVLDAVGGGELEEDGAHAGGGLDGDDVLAAEG